MCVRPNDFLLDCLLLVYLTQKTIIHEVFSLSHMPVSNEFCIAVSEAIPDLVAVLIRTSTVTVAAEDPGRKFF
jgi:hypothetical protein